MFNKKDIIHIIKKDIIHIIKNNNEMKNPLVIDGRNMFNPKDLFLR